jgi:GNAT superfamily N-acetyltransferase
MSVNIVSIAPTAKELKKYVRFGIDLYKGNPYYVPPLIFDEVNELRPEKNPSSEFCESQSFMAYRDGKPVGRVTAIINRRYNEKTGEKVARFGYVDFIDDAEVVDALFETVKAWGRERGMTTLVGPLGFSDMDKEGMLIEGFEEMGTMATIYNHPYYPGHMERMGFEKEADWIEFRMKVPDGVPEKMHRIADIVSRKFGLHIVDIISRKWVKETYGQAIFDLINEAYKDLYGYTQLTERQINYYIDMYLGILRLEDVCLIADSDDKLIGLGISMPSMSRALQKGRGRLFPFGWYHLLRAVRGHSDVVDLLLVAISPEYQGKGVNALLFDKLIPEYIKNGYQYAESNVELEGNENVQKQWEYFERRQHRRRRAWKLKL